MGLPAGRARCTIDEYLRREAVSVDRHEYHDGDVLLMAGGTYSHSRISTNFLEALGIRLRGSPCEPLDGNMRIRIPNRRSYVYPDASVVCGPPQFDADDPNRTTIVNPSVIIEVLSESTESYDRGTKFDLYREIESLQEYVLASQNQAAVETFFRHADGVWLFNPVRGLDSQVRFRALELSIPMAELYAGVELPGSGTAAG